MPPSTILAFMKADTSYQAPNKKGCMGILGCKKWKEQMYTSIPALFDVFSPGKDYFSSTYSTLLHGMLEHCHFRCYTSALKSFLTEYHRISSGVFIVVYYDKLRPSDYHSCTERVLIQLNYRLKKQRTEGP
jgi:hypothetical protein